MVARDALFMKMTTSALGWKTLASCNATGVGDG